MVKYNYILTPSRLTIVGNNKHVQINTDHKKFDEIKDLLKEQKFDEIIDMVDIKSYIAANCNDKLLIENDTLTYNGEVINNVIAKRILQFRDEGFDFNPLMKFLENQLQNPSKESVNDLYEFIEHGNMPVTSDGCFLAYKYVDRDYMDCYSHRFDNHIGCVCKMKRTEVNSDRNITCSTGLHVCTFDYIKMFASNTNHIMIVKVNPKNVVSVPVDYNSAKMRCCEYEVVDEVKNYNNGEFFDKCYYDEYENKSNDCNNSDDIEAGEEFVLNKYLNTNLRKNMSIVIIDMNKQNNTVIVRRTNGKKEYVISVDKLLKCLA